MPEKYHIETKPVPPRRPRIGKYGIVDWREDCARCHNCVKKACVYDRYREEMEYIRKLDDVDALFFDCMGCFSCVQECTKNLLRLSINPEYEKLGNHYWTPQIIQTTWLQAETAKIPVSGAGYGGKFSGYGFDSMWTDMSEIVRPTRDGIHGREYISTAVDIGRKPSTLSAVNGYGADIPPVISIPMPLLIDMLPENYSSHNLDEVIIETAYRTELIALIDSAKWPIELKVTDRYLPHIGFYFRSDSEMLPENIIKRTLFAEVEYSPSYRKRISELKSLNPGIVVAVRVNLDSQGIRHSMDIATDEMEALHIVADMNGCQTGTDRPQFIKDMIRTVHRRLVGNGIRDNITVIAGGGIALPEHMVKGIICGADLVSVELPMLLALECHLCGECRKGKSCPARIDDISFDYGAGRMTNLIAAWHDQMVELMGAMGMRDARRLRGDTGRAMFFEQLEEEIFGKLFGTRKQA